MTELIIYIAGMKFEDEDRDIYWAYKRGLTYVIVELVTNLLWENLLFIITKQVHVTSNALKALLFKKNFTISHASCSKRFSSDEVHNMIEQDVSALFVLLGQLPDLLQIPFELTVSLALAY